MSKSSFIILYSSGDFLWTRHVAFPSKSISIFYYYNSCWTVGVTSLALAIATFCEDDMFPVHDLHNFWRENRERGRNTVLGKILFYHKSITMFLITNYCQHLSDNVKNLQNIPIRMRQKTLQVYETTEPYGEAWFTFYHCGQGACLTVFSSTQTRHILLQFT